MANESVGVLVEPALSGMAGVSEVAIGVELLGDDLMVGELLAVVRGERVDKAGMGAVAVKPPVVPDLPTDCGFVTLQHGGNLSLVMVRFQNASIWYRSSEVSCV